MNEEVFKAWVAEKINDVEFHGYWDHTRSRVFGRTGRETWINGKTGLAAITVTSEGTGINNHYVAKIMIPVSSTYTRKTFIGVGNEYREEGWDTTYKYHVTYRRGLIMNRFEDESFTDPSTAADHDAVQWSQEELKNDVFLSLING